MKVKFPLMILGYSSSRVFSTENDDGCVCFPVFYDPEKAEAYRRFFAREFQQALEAYVISDAKRAIPFFQYLFSVDPALQDIVLDPPPPVEGKQGGQSIPFTQFLAQIQGQHRTHAQRRHRRRRGKKDGNNRPIHTTKE